MDWKYGNQILVEDKFSALVQTNHGAHRASCTIETVSLFWWLNRVRHGLNHQHHLVQKDFIYTSTTLLDFVAFYTVNVIFIFFVDGSNEFR
jgi:hypothetical protein